MTALRLYFLHFPQPFNSVFLIVDPHCPLYRAIHFPHDWSPRCNTFFQSNSRKLKLHRDLSHKSPETRMSWLYSLLSLTILDNIKKNIQVSKQAIFVPIWSKGFKSCQVQFRPSTLFPFLQYLYDDDLYQIWKWNISKNN